MRTGIALLGAAALVVALAGCAGSGTTVPGFQGDLGSTAAAPTPSASLSPSSTPSETSSDTPSATPTSTQAVPATTDCGNAPITLNASATLTGTCPSVLVEGENLVVNGPDVAALEIRGSGDTVSLGNVTTVTISGQTNVVGAQ